MFKLLKIPFKIVKAILSVVIIIGVIIGAFFWQNYINIDLTFNADRAEVITVCKNDNEEKFNKADKQYDSICNMLNNKGISISYEKPFPYKSDKTLKFTNGSKTKEIYFYCDKSNKENVTVIICDIFGEIDQSTSSKFPYYIITTVSYNEYLKIFEY